MLPGLVLACALNRTRGEFGLSPSRAIASLSPGLERRERGPETTMSLEGDLCGTSSLGRYAYRLAARMVLASRN